MIPLIPNPVDVVANGATNLASNWLVDLAGKTGQSAQVFIEKSATFWVTGIKTPQLTTATSQDAYSPASTVGYLWSHLHWYVSALAIFSIIFAAGKMAWQRNGAPARELLQSILTLVVVSGAGVAAISLLTTASDETASFILKDATKTPDGQPTTFQTAFGAMFSQPAATAQTAVLLIVLYGLILISTFVQIALLLVRGGMLFLLAGVLPLAAAATNTETGRQWFRKSVAWTVAFILHKPVAAIVYATAFQLTREGSPTAAPGGLAPASGDQVIKVVTGLVMCLLAVFALPALMRFTSPAVAAVAGGSGGAVATLGGALGMGAKAAMGRSSGSSSSSGAGGGRRAGGSGGGGSESATGSKPQGSRPAGASTSQAAGKTTAKGAAGGPAGMVAAAVAQGIKTAPKAANAAVNNSGGDSGAGASAAKTAGPGRGGGSSGAARPGAAGSTGRGTPPSSSSTKEGPSGGKRK
ncbi:hypothetical protein [Kribbella sp. NBC_00889]|uniref:hypothetical protein n=1 Tax=Kribbella sp. NBC_00889 TaxID=2975974 RepID=UPI00386ABF91|nr:hypothetical protein OG817_13185 [Kribbella sp. NBC_00889]